MKRFVLILILLSSMPAWAQVNWVRSFDQALTLAKKDSKPIFVDVYTDWCTWCHKLDQDVYSTPQFAKYMQNFVAVKLDAEDNKEGSKFAQMYEVEGFPTLIVTDTAGNVTNRIGGYLEAPALIEDIEGIQNLVQHEQTNPEDVLTTFELAREYLMRDMYSAAETRFKKVLAAAKATPAQKEESQFSLALTQYYQKKTQAALESLDAYEANYDNGKSEEDALLLLSQIQIEMDENDQARKTLTQFLKKFPNSGNTTRVHQVLDLLQKDVE